jgi:4-amino-4-deoxy-L-arabinose transferase-like glycosyltransferase
VKNKSSNQLWWKIGALLLVAIYFLTHLLSLDLLPVFADESIYIRWSQLIIDDWKRYLFFAMNDGKTPLFVWLTTVALKTWSDPLIAGRMVSVISGILQVFVTVKIVKKLKGGVIAQLLSAFSVMFLPYWFFHHRMALMDGLLTLLLSTSLLYLLKSFSKDTFKNVTIAGLFLGLSLFTKIPAILFFPTFVLVAFLPIKKKDFAFKIKQSSLVVLVGTLIFALLKLTPTFGQLFSRGGDFLYPVSELFEKGVFTVLWANSKRIFQALFLYLSWPVVILPIFGLFQNKLRKTHTIMILSFLGFVGSILVLGKTIYPRYILPSILPLTISAALSFEYIVRQAQKNIKKPIIFFFQTAAVIILLSSIVQTAFHFSLISWKNPNYLPFAPIDQTQYLAEWSSGNGIKESTNMMLEEIKTNSLAVATEGYFGTLPDGILMYLHEQKVDGLVVEGIGQPVIQIPNEFVEKANNYDKTWLIVNSHREKMGLNENHPELLKEEFCRIKNAPCLQVWDITSIIEELPKK